LPLYPSTLRGNINPLPFQAISELANRTFYATEVSPLGPANPVTTEVVLEPFFASDFWDLTKKVATDTKICTRGCFGADHPAAFITPSMPGYKIARQLRHYLLSLG